MLPHRLSPPRFRSTGFVRNPPRLAGRLGACLRQWHEERWGDGRTGRVSFSAEVLGPRQEAAAVFATRPETGDFILQHVGPDIRGAIGALRPGDLVPDDHPLRSFIDYAAMIGDPVMVLGEVDDDAGSEVAAENLLLLPVVADIRTVGWVVAVAEPA